MPILFDQFPLFKSSDYYIFQRIYQSKRILSKFSLLSYLNPIKLYQIKAFTQIYESFSLIFSFVLIYGNIIIPINFLSSNQPN